MRMLTKTFDSARPFALVALRVILGVLFVYHGIDKFDAGISMVEGMFRSWGVPGAGLAAPAVAVIEIVGGIALIVGMCTRMVSLLLGLVMLGALYYVKTDLGILSSQPMPGAELDLAYLAGLVALVTHGGSRFSVDGFLGLDAGAVRDSVRANAGAGREPVGTGRR